MGGRGRTEALHPSPQVRRRFWTPHLRPVRSLPGRADTVSSTSRANNAGVKTGPVARKTPRLTQEV